MNEAAFVAKREPDWIRLNQLCAKADFSPTQLSSSEIREMFKLYRKASSDLSLVRTKSTNVQLAYFLNDIVAQSYAALYRNRRKNVIDALRDAVALAAQTARKRKFAVLTSFLIFFGAALAANAILRFAPDSRQHFIPVGMEENFEHWRDQDMEARDLDQSLAATGFYMSNNPRASIITGALAAGTFGVFTAKLLFDNGALLGALAYELEPVGRVGYLLVHVFPHGVPELSGIIIAGAAGFVMGWALIHPGRRTRGEALKESGKDAIVLLAASVVLMFIAAPIEGFFSFNPRVPDVARLIVIIIELAAWGAFWIGFGRTPEEIEVYHLKKARSS